MNVEIRHAPSFAVAWAHLQPNEAIRAEAGAMMATSQGVAVEARATGGLMKSFKRSQYELRKVAGGMIQSLKSGEGFVFEFAGPGRVWTQSRNPGEFINWLTTVLPFSRT